jgi:asparagine synthetase B (glutamine-hydrolysing)
MSLPPLANVFAIESEDQGLLDEIERRVRAMEGSRIVRRPGRSWLVTIEGVPPTVLSLEEDASTFFTEGGELFDDADASTLAEAAVTAPGSLSRYDGDFGFLHVGSDQAAVFVRSCGGRVPTYVRRGPSYVAIATLLSDLVRFTPEDVVLDPLTCAIWGATSQAIFPDHRTFLTGISIVPRGHFLTITPDDRTRLHQYWDPRPAALPEPTEETRQEHVERFRALLLGTLSSELDPNGHNLLTLSGGVDSSALAALAAGSLGYPVSTLSLLPTEEPYLSKEMPYIENLRTSYRFERTWDFPLDYEGRVEAARAAPMVAFPVLHPALGHLPRVAQESDLHVLFGGEFADQVCGGQFTFPDWLRHTSLIQLAARRAEWPEGLRTPARWIKHQILRIARQPHLPMIDDLPDFVRPDVRDEYRDWRAGRQRALAGDTRALPYLAFEAERDGFVPMNWEVASAVGMRRVWPFFSRAMLELAFDCHPWELVGPGTKRLLREGLQGLVPPMNLQRQDRGHWGPSTGPHLGPPLRDFDRVFDPERLRGEEHPLPIAWVFGRLLDSLHELRDPPLYAGGRAG